MGRISGWVWVAVAVVIFVAWSAYKNENGVGPVSEAVGVVGLKAGNYDCESESWGIFQASVTNGKPQDGWTAIDDTVGYEVSSWVGVIVKSKTEFEGLLATSAFEYNDRSYSASQENAVCVFANTNRK